MNIEVENGKIKFKQSYFQQVNDWIEKSDDGDPDRQEEIARQLAEEYEMFSLQGKVTFGFRYCDNKENQLRGRVGKYSGWRTGTRDFRLMPSNKIPKKFSMEQSCIRYYDFGRMNWRSFKRTLFVVCSSFYNAKENKWYDNPKDAGYKRTWKTKNTLAMRKDVKDTDEEIFKRLVIEKKEQEKRDRQILIESKKNGLQKAQLYYDLIKGLEPFKSEAIETPKFVLKGCLMVNFACEEWLNTLSQINPADVFNNTENDYGLEFDPHCTILYGFVHELLMVEDLKEYVQHFLYDNPIDLLIQNPSFFESKDYDVLKFGVTSKVLTTLNNNIRQIFEYVSGFPDYHPHITIAYLKKSTAQQYIDKLQVPDLQPLNVVYSNPEREKTDIMSFNRTDFKI